LKAFIPLFWVLATLIMCCNSTQWVSYRIRVGVTR